MCCNDKVKHIIFFILFLAIPIASASCLTSSEQFASEVVIPNYNFAEVPFLGEKFGSSYILSSQYNSDLLVVLQETDFPKGISIKLQIPTEAKPTNIPTFKITSSSFTGSLKENLAPTYVGWQVLCSPTECVFEKGEIKMTAQKIKEQELVIEISKQLSSCSAACSGICFSTDEDSKCIDSKIRSDLDIILKYSNLSKNTRELLDSYNASTSKDAISEIIPAINLAIDWKEAMRQELVFLSEINIIEITRVDIEKISSLSKKGQSGQNNRIVFDPIFSFWRYYNEIENATLTTKQDCTIYKTLRESSEEKNEPVNTIYLVPLIITMAALISFLILLIIAKIIISFNKEREKKFKKSNTLEKK